MAPQTRNALVYSSIIALGGFVFGFDASVISGVVGYVTIEFALDPIQQGLVVSAPTLAAIFASLTVGPLADFVGRKRVLQFLALLYTISAVFSALADSYMDLVVARAIGGYAFGSLVLAPIYIAELSPARLRGRFVAINQFTIVIGLSSAYFVNYFIQSLAGSGAAWVKSLAIDERTWNWMLGVETIPALIWLVMLTIVPRSPRWLAANGNWEEAEKVLSKIAAPDAAEAAKKDIQGLLGGAKTTLADRLNTLFSRKMAFILTIGIIVAIFQQITGINIVFFYATTIFEQSGVGTNAAFAQAVIIGVVNVVFTIVAMATIDSIGRKPLLIIGLTGVALSMAVVSWGFHQASYKINVESAAQLEETLDSQQLEAIIGVEYHSDVSFKTAVRDAIGENAFRNNEAAILNAAMSADSRLILFGILGFVASFAISLGPVMWVLLSEIFPVKIRGVAISLVTIFNSGASWLVQFLFPWEVATFGAAGVFLSFSVFAVIGLVLIAWLLPETKGLSLEELETKLAARSQIKLGGIGVATLRWGVLSTGRIAEWFCEDFANVDGAELVAVCSRAQTSADAFARQFSISKTFSSYEAMLADPDIDCIYIGTPHTLHFENTKAALIAGKSVLCEKPLTVSASECQTLTMVAQETDCFLMEAMWTYFLPAMRKAKEWYNEGRIGELLHVKTDFGYPVPYHAKQREYDASLGGGCLLEMGIYPIAIASYFTEGDPVVIEAVGTVAPNGVEDDVTAILKFGSVTATIGSSFRTRLRNAAYIIGADGYIVIPDAFRCHECYLYKIDDCIDHFNATRKTRGYEYQAISMSSDLRRGMKQSTTMPLSKSLQFQEAIDEIKARLKTQ